MYGQVSVVAPVVGLVAATTAPGTAVGSATAADAGPSATHSRACAAPFCAVVWSAATSTVSGASPTGTGSEAARPPTTVSATTTPPALSRNAYASPGPGAVHVAP